MSSRLDNLLVDMGLVSSRSRANDYIKRGLVKVNNKVVLKPSYIANNNDKIELNVQNYVSRAGEKLASVAQKFNLTFKDKTVLDVGSSTGGFTQYVLRYGAKHVIAVDVGTNQMDPILRKNTKIELHEKTDIRSLKKLSRPVDYVVIDVSFISLREILPHIKKIINQNTKIIAMLKPQFEAGDTLKHKGVIKNSKIRKQIIQDFEKWLKDIFVILDSADSGLSGSKGNVERFYLLCDKA